MSVFGNVQTDLVSSQEIEIFDSPAKYFEDNIDDLSKEELRTLIGLLKKYHLKSQTIEEQHNRIHHQYRLVQRKFVDLLYFSPIGYFVFDRNGRILEANLMATNAVGHSSSIVVGKTLKNFVVEADLQILKMHHEALFHEERRTVCELKLKNKLGVEKYVRLESMLWPDEYGEQTQIITAVIDISLEKDFNDQLKQKSKINALESLVGHIAHDFNNVIHSIIANTEFMVQDSLEESDPYHSKINKRLGRILDLSTRAAESINGLLELSTDSAIVSKKIELWPFLLRHQVEFEKFIPQKIKVEWHKQNDAFTVNADEEQLRFVFINLIVKLIGKMPYGGKLTIELCKHRPTVDDLPFDNAANSDWNIVKLSYKPAQIELEVTAASNGQNVPFADLDAVLDIPQVNGIMRQHEGMVRVLQHADGQSVLLYFPAVSETASNKPVTLTKSTLEGKGKTILLVEDDDEVRDSFRDILEFHGFSVMIATNGKDGLATYKQCADQIELVITDLVMPEMDGELFLNAVKAFNPEATIIAISGYPLSIKVNDLYQNGMFTFVQKPFTIQKITRVIQDAIGT